MKRILLSIILSFVAFSAFAQKTIKLYDGPAPGSENWTHPEIRVEYWASQWQEKDTCILNVTEPELIVFQPAAGTNTGAAMIVCPGGGYYALSYTNEGLQVAEWLSAHGITAFVLKYRVSYSGATIEEATDVANHTYGEEKPDDAYLALVEKNKKVNEKLGNVRPLSLMDAQTAFKYVRSHAEEYGINPEKVGIVGFSAGGALALDLLYNHDEETRPYLVGAVYGSRVRPEMPEDPCPLFIAATQYEIAGAAQELYSMWCQNRIPAEIHSFTNSSHGFGYRSNGAPENLWITLFYNFMCNVGLIE